MPLVVDSPAGLEPVRGEAHERARKIVPEYAGGDPVRVARARNQAEAEMVQGILLEEGVPSMLRRSAGFDVPDMLAAGERDVLVPASGFEAARDTLLASGLQDLAVTPAAPPDVRLALRLALVIAAGAAAATAIAWALLALSG